MAIVFRQRAVSALTHPITVTALATLLLNDIVLKRLWPDEWVTGKLSDLAWMVFVPPLLAYLLSIIALRRNHPHTERAVFATAYVGLPLLYGAFNTFEPVHDFILRGLSLVSGGGPGSPLDATDSLVIPFAMVIAFWAWNRTPVDAGAVRARLALLTAAVAVIASVASLPPPPHQGIVAVTSYESGPIAAVGDRGEDGRIYFESLDGGFTWSVRKSYSKLRRGSSVETPTGTYSIRGRNIVHRDGDGSEVVYSAAYLTEAGNLTLQEIRTRDIENRLMTTEPYSITYDPRSGNIVVAMGLQGVVVGTPDGEWKRVSVGRYKPTDFSFIGRMLPLSDWRFAVTALAIAVSFTALGQACGLRQPAAGSVGERFMRLGGIVLAVSVVVGVAVAVSILFGAIIGIVVSFPLAPALWVLLASASRRVPRWTIFLAALGAIAAVLSALAVGDYDQGPLDVTNSQLLSLSFAGFALIIGFGVAAVNLPTFGRTWVVATSLVAIFMLTALSYVLWTQQGLGFWSALLSIVVLAALVAVALSVHLARTRSVEEEHGG